MLIKRARIYLALDCSKENLRWQFQTGVFGSPEVFITSYLGTYPQFDRADLEGAVRICISDVFRDGGWYVGFWYGDHTWKITVLSMHSTALNKQMSF